MTGKKKSEGQQHSILSIIRFFLRPYKFQVLMMFIMFLLAGVLEAATIAAVYPILNAAFDAAGNQSNIILSMFDFAAALLPIQDMFISYCALFLILAVLSFTMKLSSAIFRTKFGARLVEKNQQLIYNKLINADYQYFIDHKQGDLIYIATLAPSRLMSLLSGVTEFTAQIILSISVLSLLFSLSWQGALAVLVVGICYQFLTRYLGKKVSYYAGKGEKEAQQETNVILNETISGIKQVKAFNAEENWLKRFGNAIKRRWQFNVKYIIWSQIPPQLLLLVLYLIVGSIALTIKLVAAENFMELIPVFGAFAFAIFRLIPFVSNIGNVFMSVLVALPDCETVYSIQRGSITNITDGDKEFTSFNSSIEFDNVYFSHKSRARTIEAVSVVFEKGKTTAVVGRSGAGKTTLINLLLRLFDIDRGMIKIDGVNIKEYKLSSWLRNIGYVSQDTFILNDTIEKNITFGNDAYSREDIIKAARYADAHGFIDDLPDGYDTFVGDKGMRLSGGQAQRIAVARAMVRQPEILIFDEATNNLDSISETAVQKAIEEIAIDHTVIIIAHRLSTIVNADKILVLEDGKITEQGTHQELMKKKGAYWQLYQSHTM